MHSSYYSDARKYSYKRTTANAWNRLVDEMLHLLCDTVLKNKLYATKLHRASTEAAHFIA